MKDRFVLAFIDFPDNEPMRFSTRKEADAWVSFLKNTPVDDGPVRLRLTEIAEVSEEIL